MTTYGKPTPDTMRQNNLTFISTYNPKDPTELLFKRCVDYQKIAHERCGPLPVFWYLLK